MLSKWHRCTQSAGISSRRSSVSTDSALGDVQHGTAYTQAFIRPHNGAFAHFPLRTWSPNEVLEHTFYTHQPPTAVEMSRLISTHGGSVIVVSLLECLERYAQ